MSTKSQKNRSRKKGDGPDFSLETSIQGKVCGLDEAGRGPLAGPVVAACVYIPDETKEMDFVLEIRDSKKLGKVQMVRLFEEIQMHCIFGIAESCERTIDEMNILQASLDAMRRSLIALSEDVDHALIDGNQYPSLPCEMTTVIKGDNISTSIAAASILAKVTRDRIMKGLAEEHPHYGWERNAGYSTQEHLQAINRHGITPHHRRSFEPVRNYEEFGSIERQTSMAL